MRRLWSSLIGASVAGAATAQAEAPFVAELRLPARETHAEAVVWRAADGVRAPRETLLALGFAESALPAGDPVALAAIAGLRFTEIDHEAAIVLTCDSRCFRVQDLRGPLTDAPIAPSPPGGYLNLDIVADSAAPRGALAGAFELGLFGPAGFGEASWTAGAEGGAEIVRLETRWTLDRPDARVRVRIGDSFTRGGATGAPLRFGGVQIARDFSLDPGFVTYPTPTLRGAAQAPSTVDLYVDGALRLRERVDAGPFAIVDAPVLSGAGVAHVVVTDSLGRETLIAQPFYASPLLLRDGLSDFSFALGAEREAFARESADYGDVFASGLYRLGLRDSVTGEARLGASARRLEGGVGFSYANPLLGQIDAALAGSRADDEGGAMARLAWMRAARGFSFGAEARGVSADYRGLGAPDDAPARFTAAAALSADLGRAGGVMFAATTQDGRARPDARTLGLTYSAPALGLGALQLHALHVDDGADYFTLGASLTVALDDWIALAGGAESANGDFSSRFGARRSPDADTQFGWRLLGLRGALDRTDAALFYEGARGEALVEASFTESGDGLRGQYAAGVAWLGGAVLAGRPVRESFALVDVGAPGVGVLRDRRRVGVSDLRGRLLVTGLRAYEANRIGIVIDDLPLSAQPDTDEIIVAPGARSGILVRFALSAGTSGDARVLNASGAPLPAGGTLVRESDGARFPIGGGGRIYLTGVTGESLLAGDGCVVRVAPDALMSDAPLVCVAG